jgi:HIT domain-containing protein
MASEGPPGCVFCGVACERPDNYVPVDTMVLPTLAFANAENFRVLLDNAPLADGHVLVVPKRHIRSLGEASETEVEELERLIAWLSSGMRALSGHEPLLFEHGTADDASTAVAVDLSSCCLVHAHLHVVPSAVDVVADLEGMGARHLATVGRLSDLRAARGRDYLFVRVPADDGRIYDAEGLPSQLMRRFAAGEKVTLWNWKDRLMLSDPVALAEDVARGARRLTDSLAAANGSGAAPAELVWPRRGGEAPDRSRAVVSRRMSRATARSR